MKTKLSILFFTLFALTLTSCSSDDWSSFSSNECFTGKIVGLQHSIQSSYDYWWVLIVNSPVTSKESPLAVGKYLSICSADLPDVKLPDNNTDLSPEEYHNSFLISFKIQSYHYVNRDHQVLTADQPGSFSECRVLPCN